MKHFSGFLALFFFASLPLYAADLSDLTYTTFGGEVTITDCDPSATGELVIPETVEGNPVLVRHMKRHAPIWSHHIRGLRSSQHMGKTPSVQAVRRLTPPSRQ